MKIVRDDGGCFMGPMPPKFSWDDLLPKQFCKCLRLEKYRAAFKAAGLTFDEVLEMCANGRIDALQALGVPVLLAEDVEYELDQTQVRELNLHTPPVERRRPQVTRTGLRVPASQAVAPYKGSFEAAIDVLKVLRPRVDEAALRRLLMGTERGPPPPLPPPVPSVRKSGMGQLMHVTVRKNNPGNRVTIPRLRVQKLCNFSSKSTPLAGYGGAEVPRRRVSGLRL